MSSLFNSFVLATFFFVCFQCSIFLFVESGSLSIETDKEALISFRSQIRSDDSNSLSSWDQNSSPCNWTGVVCDKFGERVIDLKLSSMGLVGSISPHIGNLSFLQSLQLQKNQLQGALPQEITSLVRLSVLNLSLNNFEGPIPSNISKLKELRVLDMMRNKIAGRVPEELTFLSKLQVLNLRSNLLSGAIPPSVVNLSSLTDLNLGTNSLTGTIPNDLSRLQSLKFLDLTKNNLIGTAPPSIYNMSSLKKLALASNRLWGEIPANIGEMLPNLLIFNICLNNFTGRIPGSLHNLTNIQGIRMASNLLEGTVPPGLGNLPFLTMYNIMDNKIVNSREDGLGFITSLTNSTHLEFLAFDRNFLQGEIPDSVGNLSKVLTRLYMGNNQIHGSIPASIGRLESLTLLDMSYNLMTGQIPREIGQLKYLHELGLAGNKFSGVIPDSFGNLQKLNKIYLTGNQLVGDIPATLGNFPNLLSMDLSNNRLNGSIPKEILNLRSLSSVLNLSNNFLRGQLPQEIGLLVVAIDLSNNNLSGSIPSSIGNCKSLQKLDMARNTLSGPIPGSLGEVKGLETLDLSYNRISGPIPAELQQLRALKSLNLSFNDLKGAVPDGGIFKNGSEVQLEGNPKLCLHSACRNTQTRGRRLVKLFIIIASVAALVLCISVAAFFYIRKRAKMIIGTSVLIKERHEMVSYNQLRQATGNFYGDYLIGNGSFGSVYKGYLRDDVVVAVKVLDNQRTGFWKSFLAECEALRNVRHRNLVKLITSCSSIDSKNMEFLALVYEFLRNGSLEDWLKGNRKKENGDGLNFMERLNVAIDIASAVDYLQNDCEVPVVHCDLKPSNILLDEDMTAKIGDFGLARLLLEQMGDNASISSTHVLKGSIGYIPPEYGLGVKPSTAGDTYCFGVMLLEIFTGKSPTDDSFMGEQNLVGWVQSAFPIDVIRVLDPELPLVDSGDSLIKILGVGLSCTIASPEGRISIRDALHMLETIKNCMLTRGRNRCVRRGRADT